MYQMNENAIFRVFRTNFWRFSEFRKFVLIMPIFHCWPRLASSLIIAPLYSIPPSCATWKGSEIHNKINFRQEIKIKVHALDRFSIVFENFEHLFWWIFVVNLIVILRRIRKKENKKNRKSGEVLLVVFVMDTINWFLWWKFGWKRKLLGVFLRSALNGGQPCSWIFGNLLHERSSHVFEVQ